MKNGLALIHKIWSDLKEKEYCRSVVNIEKGKWRNGNKIEIRSSWMKRGEGEREREKKKVDKEREKNEMS
jgi:hypothetical protein